MSQITVHRAKINAFVRGVQIMVNSAHGPVSLDQAIELMRRYSQDEMDSAQLREAEKEARRQAKR
jgi:hypothetical protein